jgi:hypothetical protein
VFLSRPEWQARRAAHELRVDALLGDHLERRRRGLKHPVRDFLFTYYSYRPGQLRRWFPGVGVELEGVEPIDPQETERRYGSIRWIRDLLVKTSQRSGNFGCFGLHEWAMVYRQSRQELRHNAYPLRIDPDPVVEERGVRCGHFDAFRFFTKAARPLNLLQPTRDTQPDNEQPGCLHANMDLYKWSYKLAPFTPAELIADCFELAAAVRELDMRASPYDLQDLGYSPVRIETPEGRAEYAAAQRNFSEQAQPLREKLIEVCLRALQDI